nr:Mitochondrial glycoprotein [Ipomoea batatas]
MASILRASRRSLIACGTTINASFSQPQRFAPGAGGFSRALASQSLPQTVRKSPFDSNILRILHNEIDYLSVYAPPDPHVTKFNEFTVEDHPGEQWITLKSKFQQNEEIKIEATMFDGSISVPKSGYETSEDVRLHISLLVDIWKKEGGEALEFVCSAWPDSLEVQNVYVFRREGLQSSQPYMGPNVKDLNSKLHDALYKFLKRRGINDELSVFLHNYMMNKDRTEIIQWLRKIKSFIEE